MSLNITGLKDNWQDIKISQQEKLKFIEQMKFKHLQDTDTYVEYNDYLKPKLLKAKLQTGIKDLINKTDSLNLPI